jgi:hypothetical protein
MLAVDPRFPNLLERRWFAEKTLAELGLDLECEVILSA